MSVKIQTKAMKSLLLQTYYILEFSVCLQTATAQQNGNYESRKRNSEQTRTIIRLLYKTTFGELQQLTAKAENGRVLTKQGTEFWDFQNERRNCIHIMKQQ